LAEVDAVSDSLQSEIVFGLDSDNLPTYWLWHGLLASVDIFLEMRHPGGDPFTRRRKLTAWSRYEEGWQGRP
jgi:hypothetical protein